MCLKLNMYLRALLNLARSHHDCVSGKISKTDHFLDPVHILYSSQSETSKIRGSEPFGVDRPMAGDYTFHFFYCNKDKYRCRTVRLHKNIADLPRPGK